MLIVVSGCDRVGKTTLISGMEQALDGDAVVMHHSAPPKDQENIFDFYKEDILKWLESDKKHCIFDRAWPCSFILEQQRRNNLGHLEDLIDLELWVNDVVGCDVVHLAQLRPWHWSAPHHIIELKEDTNVTNGWFFRDQYVSRMKEHEIYQTQLIDFYESVTMFPNVQLTGTVTAIEALQQCQAAANLAKT